MTFSDYLKFDWYSASLEVDIDLFHSRWRRRFPHDCLESSKARNGFTHADSFLNPSGETTVTAMYGGEHQNNKVNIFASGDKAETFADFIRSEFPEHALVRADICIDYNHVGAWSGLTKLGVHISETRHIKNKMISPVGQQQNDDSNTEGRTLYLGSRSSVGCMRIYEKGKKDNPEYPDWVRVELEFKPKGDARRVYAKATKEQMVHSIKWASEYFQKLGISHTERPCPAGSVYVLNDHQKTLRHLVYQYEKTFLKVIEENSGSVEALGKTILDILDTKPRQFKKASGDN